MTTVTRNFFTFANNETEHWQELPEYATKAFGLYLMCEGEATYCCSLTPSSYAIGLQNVFSCKESDAEKLHKVLDDSGDWEREGIDHTYFGFINPEGRRDCSKPVEISIDTDLEINEDEPLPESVHDELWREALEHFSGTLYEPDCCEYEKESS